MIKASCLSFVFLALACGQPLTASSPESVNTPSSEAAPSCASNDASCLVLSQDQSVQLDDLSSIRFISVAEDSRCPVGAFCIWAGQVRVVLSADTADHSEKFELGIGGTLADSWTDLNGRSIKLVEVWPGKDLNASTKPAYQIKLKLESRSDEESPAQNETR